jgi:hypothetical protein
VRDADCGVRIEAHSASAFRIHVGSRRTTKYLLSRAFKPAAIATNPLFAIYNEERKRTGPGGPPGLQNRLLPADAGGLGSTPRRFRHSF